MAHSWDPAAYLEYGDERARPFLDLVARISAVDPRAVVDLGCGPGTLTTLLKRRWPAAHVIGVDSSPAMVAAADPGLGVDLVVADLRDWSPKAPVDVLVSNAALQWVPGHLALLPRLVRQVTPGGWIAFQVPGNFAAPTHVLRQRLEKDARFAPHLEGVEGPHAHDPEVYLEALLDLGCQVDVWETTYLHLLTGDDPVFAWAVGTGARPTLAALPDGVRQEFERELRDGLRQAYPGTRHGTLLPFRRVFAVARTAG